MKSFILAAVLWSFCSMASAFDDYSTLYENVLDSVVVIHTMALVDGKAVSGLGSGVLVEPNLVITAAHVVGNVSKINVGFSNEESLSAELVSYDPRQDIALLRLAQAPLNATVAKLGVSSNVKVGEPLFVIGAPFGLAQSLSAGFLSGRMVKGMTPGGEPLTMLQTDAAINTGNSGGPVFNRDGEVVGISSFILSKTGGSDGVGFAIAIDSVKKTLLESFSYRIGGFGNYIHSGLAPALNLPQSGIIVEKVFSGSVFEQVGLKPGSLETTIEGQTLFLGGDVILSWNGKRFDGTEAAFNEFIDEMVGFSFSGGSFDVEIARAGAIINLTGTMTSGNRVPTFLGGEEPARPLASAP